MFAFSTHSARRVGSAAASKSALLVCLLLCCTFVHDAAGDTAAVAKAWTRKKSPPPRKRTPPGRKSPPRGGNGGGGIGLPSGSDFQYLKSANPPDCVIASANYCPCLDERLTQFLPAASVGLASCWGTGNQLWARYGTALMSGHSKRCLDAGSSPSAGDQNWLAACDQSAGQQWFYLGATGQLQLRGTNLCLSTKIDLTVRHLSTTTVDKDPARSVLATCSSGLIDDFQVFWGPSIGFPNWYNNFNTHYTISLASSSRTVMQVPVFSSTGKSADDSNGVSVGSLGGGGEERFLLTPEGWLHSESAGLCLDAGSRVGKQLILSPCSQRTGQLFTYQSNRAIQMSDGPGFCLESNLGVVKTAACSGSANQAWVGNGL